MKNLILSLLAVCVVTQTIAQIVVTPVNKQIICCGTPNPFTSIDSFSIQPYTQSKLFIYSIDFSQVNFAGFYLVNEDHLVGSGTSKMFFSQGLYPLYASPSNSFPIRQFGHFKKIGEPFSDNNWPAYGGVRYIQLRYQLNSSIYYYGWLKMRLGKNPTSDYFDLNDTLIVEEYAMNTIPNQEILMGQTTPTTISEINSNLNFSVYPNPSNHVLYLHSSRKLNIKSIELYTIAGQQIKLQSMYESFSNVYQFNISELKNGVYYFMIQTESSSEIVKFCKL